VAPFGPADFAQAAQANGVPSALAPYLGVLAYKTTPIRYIRQLVVSGVMDDASASDALQDGGYLPSTADNVVAAIHATEDAKSTAFIAKEVNSLGSRITKAIEKAYASGAISVENATAQLQGNGFTYPQAVNILRVSDMEFAQTNLDTSVKAIEESFNSGAISAADAEAALVTMGLDPARVTQTVASWLTRFTFARRTSTITQVVEWFKSGYLTEDQASHRLSTLGYSAPDQLLILQAAQRGIDDTAAKQLRAQQQTAAQQARTLTKLAAEAHRQAVEMQKKAKALTPLSTLKSWLKKGIIDVDYFLERVLQLGYPLDV